MRSTPKKVLWLTNVMLLFGVRSVLAQEAGSIQGKVTDSSGAPIFGAVVNVEGGGGSSTTMTDMEGAFQISLLPPGNFKVKISASGMSDWNAESVPASVADAKPLLAVMQVAPTAASVTVGLSPEELAADQVKRETQQRVAGIIPNYFVAYDNQAPLSTQQKFTLSLRRLSTRPPSLPLGLPLEFNKSGTATTNSVRASRPTASVLARPTEAPPPTFY